jgi:hypothetical protein
MEARDFLDIAKRRMLALRFPGFTVFDSCTVLLDAGFSEVMSDERDITIAGIVIPELTFRLTHTDMADHIGEVIRCEVGLEQSQEDVTGALSALDTVLQSDCPVFAKSISGLWFAASGTVLHSAKLLDDGTAQLGTSYTCEHEIGGILLHESRVNRKADGTVSAVGMLYLLHEAAPYLTAVPYVSMNGRDCSFGGDADCFPDIDGDGLVTAADAEMIATAAANIGAGEPSGLTKAQERRADADLDGAITASDAETVQAFAAAVGAGDYTNDPAGWLAFLAYDPDVGPVTDGLHARVLSDMAAHSAAVCKANVYPFAGASQVLMQTTEIRWSRYYDRYAERISERPGTLCRHPVGGRIVTFAPASYGEFLLTETSSQDEDTTDVRCCGPLHRLIGLDASTFFTSVYFMAEDFAELFANFTRWLRDAGIPIEPAAQDYRNLHALPVIAPDWQTADFTGVTADQVLREFALFEGGNAYLDRDGRLRLGWCGTEPVLTVSADVLGSLRIGNERLASATGLDPFWNPMSRNVIETELKTDELALISCTSAQALSMAFQHVVEGFANASQIPFDGELLSGASPLLRVGDTIRTVTRSGVAVEVQLMEQDVRQFPQMTAALSSPDGTSWETQPLHPEDLQVTAIEVEHYPAFVIQGELPDTTGMSVTAVQRGGGRFAVDTALCRIELGTVQTGGNVLMTVRFAGCFASKYIPVRYLLLNNAGEPFLTVDGAGFAVAKQNSTNGYCSGLNGVWLLSAEEYERIPHDPETKYIVRDTGSVKEYLGDIPIGGDLA